MKKKTRNIAIAGLCTVVLGSASVGGYLVATKAEAPTNTNVKQSQTAKSKNPFANKAKDKTKSPFDTKKEPSLGDVFRGGEVAMSPFDKQNLLEPDVLYKEKQVAYKELAQLVSTATKTPANVAPTPITLDTKPMQPRKPIQPQEEIKEPEEKPTPIPDPVIPTPTPNPVEPVQPEPKPDPEPEPQPEPKPDPERIYEAYLTVPDVITIHALSKFDIADYANAIDESGANISSSITLSQAIDTTKVGEQQVYVEVVNHNVKAGKIVTVEVLNDAPVFDGLADKIVDVGENVDLLNGVTATDTEEGDLTAKIEVTGEVDTSVEGTYTILYTVKDRFGAETTKQVNIEVVAKVPTFEGVEDATIFIGTLFDPNDGITVNNMYEETMYTVTGEVDTATAGVYTLTYHAVNTYGKETTVTRQITVVE
ncbi:immunoglobulin-like domain-containing protein [Listeria booriae]|uniref:DUF5011 domain-containing protein n=1 Tax=Listeria booriae TaxID=1552123 RepID=A0A7X0WGQ9_9LIST|nr:immunoglobulin-like domain-containing protein [Listeria booriae]MBC1333543.1 DUF5011 domain-containing protein [Listeria booriae]